MLRPIDTETREVKTLDGLWRFAVDSADSGLSSSPWTSELPGTLECPVPASYNDLFVETTLRNHVGKVWYQRLVRIPRGWSNQNFFIRVDAATHAGEVYVDDTLIGTHIGGYMPFEADLTKHARPGQEVRITIGVDNTLTNHTIPPGELVKDDIGHTSQRYWHDFYNYAGLARSVHLCSVPPTHVDDVTVTTDVSGTTGTVNYVLSTTGAAPDSVQVDLLDAKGSKVASSTEKSKGSLTVKSAKLWQPGAAYLYRLRIRLQAKSETVDEYFVNVGIRSVKVKGFEILINDKPFYFKGYGKHEDTPVKGKGHDNAWMVHDFELMKWTGANSFRTSHYPYAEEVMDYADRMGIVIIDETPAVGLNLSIGGGIFGPEEKRKTFSEDFAGKKTQKAHAHSLHELIKRDKNHPSVVLWCITNEPDSSCPGAREYFEPLCKLARELDPTRPLTYTNVMFVKPEKCLIADLFDVIGLNRYYGWYENNGDLATAERRFEDELQRFQDKFKRPLLILEYGCDTVAGLHAVGDVPWSEEYQSRYYDMNHRVFDRLESVQGEQVWNFADFNTGPGIFRVDGNKKGIFTRDRKPKLAAHTLRKRWTAKEGK